MDEDLRRLERGGDPLRVAQAALRAGESGRALVAARAAVEGGGRSREEVEAWLWEHIPLGRELQEGLTTLSKAGRNLRVLDSLLMALAGAGDPRVDRELSEWSAVVNGPADLAELLRAPPVMRWLRAVERLDPDAFVFATLGEGEALAVATAYLRREPASLTAADQDPESARRLMELCLVHQLAPYWERPEVAALLEAWPLARDPLVASELAVAAGREGERLADGAAPWRPPWVDPGRPAQVRDRLTLSHHRTTFLRGGGRQALADATGVLYVDMDETMRLNDEHGHLVGDAVLRRVADLCREVVGDRLARVGGDEWVIPWDGPDSLDVAHTLVAAVRAGGEATIKVGLDRGSGPGLTRLERAREAFWHLGRRPRDEVLEAAD
ncbi:MAG: diguanylate cyclase [Planctomycetota bacterium]